MLNNRSEDQVVLGETSLSFALSISHSRVEQIRANITAERSDLMGIWTPLSEPLSVQNLTGAASTSGSVPATVATVTALSTTFASRSSIPPITVDDYEVVNADGQENSQRDVASFPTVDFEKEKLDTTPKRVVRFRKKEKLAPRFIRPFEIIERIDPVAYRLRLPKELNGVHDTFHVSNLKKCLADLTLHIPLDEIQVDAKLNFVEESVEILEREFKKLKWSRIAIVKGQRIERKAKTSMKLRVQRYEEGSGSTRVMRRLVDRDILQLATVVHALG
ncbi:hypothetical protein Tco_0322506 [Tanacetum coccineum]